MRHHKPLMRNSKSQGANSPANSPSRGHGGQGGRLYQPQPTTASNSVAAVAAAACAAAAIAAASNNSGANKNNSFECF